MSRQPDAHGHFGPFGGRYVAETLMPALLELEQAYRDAQADPSGAAAHLSLLSAGPIQAG